MRASLCTHAHFDIPKIIMNLTLESERQLIQPTTLPRLSTFDRVALHGGLALIRWARRAEQAPHAWAELHRRRAQSVLAQATLRRELVEATHRLTVPR